MDLKPSSSTAFLRARRVLAGGVLIQSAVLLWLAWRHGTVVNSLVFMGLELPERTAQLVDTGLASIAAVAALCIVFAGVRILSLAVAGVFLLQALATVAVGGAAFSDWAPAAHATRWLAPLALLALTRGQAPATAPRPAYLASTILRVSIATTFATHGIEALQHHPRFIDLLLGSARRWLEFAPSEAAARGCLTAIGVLDLAVAALLLVLRSRALAIWATIWGAATLASRVVALGPEFAHESGIRCMNAAAPLALFLLWSAREFPQIHRPTQR